NADNYLFSFFELWKMAMMYGVYLAIWNYLDYTHDFTTVLYSLGVTVVLGFFPVVTQHYSGIMQVYGIFPHQNSAAVFMVLCTPLFFSRFFNSTDMKKDIFIIPSLFCGSISLILTYSRGGMFCLPLAISVTILVSLIFQFSATKLIYCFVFIAAAILIGALFVPRIVQRFETAPKESANTRIILAGSAWNMMKDKFLGVGINNWGIKINHPYNYKPKGSKDWGYGDKNFKRPLVETVYLLVGAECGFLGLLYFICWLWYYLIVGVLMLKPLRNTSYFYLPAGIVGGLVGIYLQSALEWVLKQQINYLELMIFFAIIGFLHVKIKENKKQRSTSVV
ncbi:MAG: O-antigen ligase family protein, partial [Lentisphaeria bacterium]